MGNEKPEEEGMETKSGHYLRAPDLSVRPESHGSIHKADNDIDTQIEGEAKDALQG